MRSVLPWTYCAVRWGCTLLGLTADTYSSRELGREGHSEAKGVNEGEGDRRRKTRARERERPREEGGRRKTE